MNTTAYLQRSATTSSSLQLNYHPRAAPTRKTNYVQSGQLAIVSRRKLLTSFFFVFGTKRRCLPRVLPHTCVSELNKALLLKTAPSDSLVKTRDYQPHEKHAEVAWFAKAHKPCSRRAGSRWRLTLPSVSWARKSLKSATANKEQGRTCPKARASKAVSIQLPLLTPKPLLKFTLESMMCAF